MTTRVADLAFARPGDKGNDADLSLFAPDRATYDLLVEQVTADRVRAHLGHLVAGEVRRWEVPHVLALKFLCTDALAGGGPSSLRADNLGKTLAGALLTLELEGVDAPPRARPPVDPYRHADWRLERPSP
ncbi:MAG: hypothetical protein KY434_08020 [Actinobacteria bacterium]|nr:hypothetical protein [Actinomycetota bacterium]